MKIEIRWWYIVVHTILSRMFYFSFWDKYWVIEIGLGYAYLTAPSID